MVVQFIVDHVGRARGSQVVCELPPQLDEALVRAKLKGHLGPSRVGTVVHRLAVLSKLHQLRRVKPNPCEDPEVRHLLAKARRAAWKRGEAPRKKTPAIRDAIEAMAATCDESLQGLRDKALLYFAWASGGRRRSEVVTATVEQLTVLDSEMCLFNLGQSKTDQSGDSGPRAKPLRGKAAVALKAWLVMSGIAHGPIFRRVWRCRLGPALSPAAVAQIVKHRAALAGLAGDWAGHSLRSGLVTEAGRRGVPLGDVMAMTDHRKVDTVLSYYRPGELLKSTAANLL